VFITELIEKCPEAFLGKIKRKRKGFVPFSIKEEGIDLFIFVGFEKKILEHYPDKKIIFLEPDPGVMLGCDCKDVIFLSEDYTQVIKELVWKYALKKKQFFCHPEIDRAYFNKLKAFYEKTELGRHLSISDVSDFGIRAFRNICENLSFFSSMKNGKRLHHAFKDVPAVICGAGPSIKDQIQKIEKLKDKALIFAGGSALNVFAKEKTLPHFGGSVDKIAPFDKFKEHFGYLIPFFVQLRANAENLSLVNDPIVFGESNKNLFEVFLEECFSISSFSSGWCVGNFLTQVASFLGCDPIILVGMDFSYPKDQKYADSRKSSKPVVTQNDFIMAKAWVKEFANSSSNTVINASKSYGGDSKLIDMTLDQVIESVLTKTFDLSGMVHQKINQQENDLLIEEKKVLVRLLKSLNNCEKIINTFYKKNKLCREKLEQEIAYRYIISPIWNIFAPIIVSYSEDKKKRGFEKKIQETLFFQRIIKLYITEIARFV